MVNFFLDRLHANNNVAAHNDSTVLRAIDNKYISGYDMREIAIQLACGAPVNKCVNLCPIFYNRLFLAYLLNDTDFDNTSWGFDMNDFKPMRYIPKSPFALKDTYFKYKWGGVSCTPDYLIVVDKNLEYALEVCRVLTFWYKDRNEMYLDYSRKHGMKNVVEWSNRFREVDSRAYTAYMSLLTVLHNDERFIPWLEKQPITSCSEDMLTNGVITVLHNIEQSSDVLGYCLSYLKEITSPVAS